MKPTLTPEMIEAHAIADAKFAGMDFATLGRADKKRFLERAASCLSAALSVQPAAAVVGEAVAYASSKEWRKNHLMSAAQYKNALPKNVVDFDIPLYATLPNEALERSEQATFDIAARLLKERDALAGRISQQDAELERVRRELAEAEKKFETADKLRVFWNDKATELGGKLDDARSNVFAESALIAYAINTRGETAISLQFLIVRALRAKAEGENHG